MFFDLDEYQLKDGMNLTFKGCLNNNIILIINIMLSSVSI
jgi:hypothetical protein